MNGYKYSAYMSSKLTVSTLSDLFHLLIAFHDFMFGTYPIIIDTPCLRLVPLFSVYDVYGNEHAERVFFVQTRGSNASVGDFLESMCTSDDR